MSFRKYFSIIIISFLITSIFIPFFSTGIKITTDKNYFENKETEKINKTIISKNVFFKKMLRFYIKHDLDEFPKIKEHWKRYFGGNRLEMESSIDVDPVDQSVYVIGNSMSYYNHKSPFMVKYDSNGKKIWEKNLFKNRGSVYSLKYYNGYIFACGFIIKEDNSQKAFLAKYNRNGDEIWFTSFARSSYDIGFDLICKDDIIYVSGRTYNGNIDVLLFAIGDKENYGKILWSKTWGYEKDDDALGIEINYDTLYLCGTTTITGKNTHDCLLLSFNLNEPKSNLKLFSTWQGKGYDQLEDIMIYKNCIYAVGWTGINNNLDIVLLKYNLEKKKLIWDKIWSERNYNVGYGLTVNDNYIYVTGHIIDNSGISQESASLFLKYDLNGKLIWNKIWGENIFSTGEDLSYHNGNIYASGYCLPRLKSYSDIYVFKCNKNGESLSKISKLFRLFN